MLSEEEKKKIEEEERYRAKVKKDLPHEKPKKKGVGFIKGLFFIIIIFITIGAIATAISPSTHTQNNSPSSEPITQQYKDSLAKMFCDNRSDGKRYVDLQPLTDGFKSKPTETTKKPTPEECMGATNYCLKVWAKKEDCENIANKKIWIGMTGLQLYISLGYPRDINNTTNTYGIRSQQVYGDFGPYIYLEGKTDGLNDMKVTSWQD